jgi:Ca2+-transporting ATPase
LALLWDQFKNFLVIVLIIAAAISTAPGEYVDSVAIMFIVVLNAVAGVFQESKTQTKTLAAP